MAQDAATYVKTGDLVTLFSEDGEEDGYIACGGSSDDQLVVTANKDKDCVFKIVPMMQYADPDTATPAGAGMDGAMMREVRFTDF